MSADLTFGQGPALPYPEAPKPKKKLSPKQFLIGAGVVVALVIGAVATSGPSDDEKFINRLNEGGVHYNSEKKAIAGAHAACDYLDKGYSVDQATESIVTGTTINAYNAGYVVGAAIYAYCPKYGNQIS